MNPKQPISFDLDARLATQLLEVMRQEQAALIHADVDVIEDLLVQKSSLLQRMNLAVINRYEALAAHGLEASEMGMMAWLKQQASPSIHSAWNSFKKTLIEAKEINRLNGLLINRQFNLNQQTLQLLQGQTGSVDTYGKSGKADHITASRPALLV